MVSPTLLLTNRHIVQSKDNDLSYTVTRFLEDGSPELVGGKIVKWSVIHEEDLALVELKKSNGESFLDRVARKTVCSTRRPYRGWLSQSFHTWRTYSCNIWRIP